MDPDPDPGGPKTYGSDGSGSATLVLSFALFYTTDASMSLLRRKAQVLVPRLQKRH